MIILLYAYCTGGAYTGYEENLYYTDEETKATRSGHKSVRVAGLSALVHCIIGAGL